MSLEGKTAEEIAALATLTDNLMGNPKTRSQFQRLLKTANPNLSVPEVELADHIAAATKPLEDKLAQQDAEREQNRAKEAANTLFETLRDDRVVKSRGDFSELVKYAAEKGFMTNEAGLRMAAQHRTAEQEPAEPTPYTAGQVDLSQREQHKDLLSNPQGWARTTALKALDELRGKKAA